MKNRTDKFLLGFFLVSLAVYIAIFAACFSELPINPTPLHQALVLYFHFIPMFLLQLLLCRRAKLHWQLLIPPALLLIPGLVFVSIAGWHIMAWVLFLFWCAAPSVGCLLAWAVCGCWKWYRKGGVRNV